MKILKRFMMVLSILFIGFLLSSCNKDEPIKTTKEESYSIEMNLSYGDSERNILDFYMPKDYKKDSFVLFIHGGAWVSGDKSFYSSYVATLAEIGIPCASMNYRYVSKTINCYDLLDDITNALAFIKEHAMSEYNVNLNQVALFGYSSGAHLAMLYGYKYKDISPVTPRMVLSLAGPTDLSLDSFFGISPLSYTLFSYMIGKKITKDTINDFKEDLDLISPIHYVNSNTIPTILVQGLKDTTVNPLNASILNEKLESYNVLHEFILLPNSDHLLSNDKEIFNTIPTKFYMFYKNIIEG